MGETTQQRLFFSCASYSNVGLRLNIGKNGNHFHGKRWRDPTFPDSSQEVVERGETIGSFLFPRWSFTFDTGKWEPDREAWS